jgi:hypothetical protein
LSPGLENIVGKGFVGFGTCFIFGLFNHKLQV